MKRRDSEIEFFKSIEFDGMKLSSNSDGTKIYCNNRLVPQHKIKSKSHKHGFMACKIGKYRFYTHQIVAMIYVPNPRGYEKCIHLDTNSLNNHYKNLAWGTTEMIVQNMYVAGRMKNRDVLRKKSKISAEELPKVIKRLENGETLKSIAIDYNTSDMSISRIKKRYCNGNN